MYIRKAAEGDLPRMMEIYAVARRFMAAHGNPNQWGPTNWPPEERIRADIAEGSSYVCVRQNRVVGAFYFRQGEGIEPTYQRIENGAWKEAGPYGVIHRLAGDGSAKGIGTLCLGLSAVCSSSHRHPPRQPCHAEFAAKERICPLRNGLRGGGHLPQAGL